MTLDEYLSKQTISSAKFADLVGVDRAYITRLRQGIGNPTKAVMERIIAASGGQVTPADLLATSELERTVAINQLGS